MNLYIPYSAARDVLKGLELKYALRSIEKYLTGWGKVILIGERPEWFMGTTYWHWDVAALKETSIHGKMIIAAAIDESDDENILMWHDDHYLLQPLNVNDFKQWYSSSLAYEITRPHGPRYQKALTNTLDRFPNERYFDCHTPIIFNKKNLQQLNWDKEYCLKSLYCNSFPDESEYMEDLKIDTYMSKEEIKKKIEGRLFLSTGCVHDPMIEVLNELFPDKSKFEK
jgi:hypothetical protein